MSQPRKHHYVPSFYLAGFTREGTANGRLCVLNLYSGESWKLTPLTAANQRDFYRLDGTDDPQALEKMLGQIEGNTKTLLTEIEASNTLPDPGSQRHFELMFFLAVMLARVPRPRADASKVMERNAKRMLRENAATPEAWKATLERLKAKGLGDFSDTAYAEWNDFLDRDQFKLGMTQGQHLFLMMKHIETIYPYLAGRKWHLQIASDDSGEFACSDNPAMLTWTDQRMEAVRGTPGFAHRETEFTMPLTRRLAVRGRFEGMNASVRVSKRTVATTNTRTLFLARQAYSSSEDFPWLCDGRVGSRVELMEEIQISIKRRAAEQAGTTPSTPED